MDYRKEVRNIHKKREIRKRKKLVIKLAIILAVLAVVTTAAAVYISTGASRSPVRDSDVMPTATTMPTIALNETSAPVSTATATPTSALPEEPVVSRRGTWEPIPEDVKELMSGSSMPKNASVSFEELAYLTIPYYDFDYNIVEGHLVVNAKLADEVLNIFAELYDIKYPIERMRLIDYYGADDYVSIDYNNTSAFNYRESTDGSGRLSQHALGCAIDINPQINPYVNSSGVGSHDNASEYWSRDISSWNSNVAKAAYIGPDSEIYNIFVNKYGWEWGGLWSSYRDYQHFQKSI